MGLQVTRAELLPAFVKLLQVRGMGGSLVHACAPVTAGVRRDSGVHATTGASPTPPPPHSPQVPEAEVRASAAANVAAYAALIGPDAFLGELLPAVRDCVVDVAQNVRTAAGKSLMEVAATLEHDAAVGSVLPLILQCLRDEAPEVRLTVLESLGKVTHTLGPAFIESAVLPTLQKLGEDPLWRVREQVIQQMAMLAGVLVRGGGEGERVGPSFACPRVRARECQTSLAATPPPLLRAARPSAGRLRV